MKTAKLKNKGLFKVDGYNQDFTGYSNPEENWNGWVCPYFELDEALRILETSDGIRFYEHKKLSNGLTVISWLDDDNEMVIVEGEKVEAFGKEVEVFSIGTYGWCWEGVDCDPERPGLSEDEKMLVEAKVEPSDVVGHYAVVLYKNGVDFTWWAVFEHTSAEDCNNLAANLNSAFRHFELTR